MKNYARIEDGKIVEVVPLPDGMKVEESFIPEFVAQLVECGAEVTDQWRYEDGEFLEPLPLEELPPAQKRQFSFLEFLDLFTESDQLTLVEASMTIPAIKLWYDKALGAAYIDLDDERTIAGMVALVDANLITAERKNAVLAGNPPL